MKVKLTEICTPKQWKTIPTNALLEDGYPVYGANGIIGYYDEYNHEEPVIAITCRGATCGTINLTVPKAYITGNAMCLDNVCADVLPDYLYYCLLHYNFNNIISGSAQPQITRQGLAKVEIELHPIIEQGKIINSLRKSKAIINARQSQLQKLDDLVKARFVEMFGDCKSRVSMNELCSIITDGTHQPPRFQESGIPFIFVSNLVGNVVTYNAEKFISEDTYAELYKRTPIEIGDLLLSTVGSYGHPAVVTEDRKFLFQRHIAYLKPRHNMVNSFYLHSALLAPDGQRQIEEKVKGIAQKTLNLSEIKKIVVPLPTIEEQNQFEKFVNQTDKSKLQVPSGNALCIRYPIFYRNNIFERSIKC